MATDSDEKEKALIKQAINEWLETKWAIFGKFSAYGILAAFVGFLCYMAYMTHGFKIT